MFWDRSCDCFCLWQAKPPAKEPLVIPRISLPKESLSSASRIWKGHFSSFLWVQPFCLTLDLSEVTFKQCDRGELNWRKVKADLLWRVSECDLCFSDGQSNFLFIHNWCHLQVYTSAICYQHTSSLHWPLRNHAGE